jgi:hypothetical protein
VTQQASIRRHLFKPLSSALSSSPEPSPGAGSMPQRFSIPYPMCCEREEQTVTTVEKIIERLKTMPQSAQNEVLDFVEHLKSKARQQGEDYDWSQFSLESAMRGIEEEP